MGADLNFLRNMSECPMPFIRAAELTPLSLQCPPPVSAQPFENVWGIPNSLNAKNDSHLLVSRTLKMKDKPHSNRILRTSARRSCICNSGHSVQRMLPIARFIYEWPNTMVICWSAASYPRSTTSCPTAFYDSNSSFQVSAPSPRPHQGHTSAPAADGKGFAK